MPWVNGNVCVTHSRAPWSDQTPAQILVHARLDHLKGTDQASTKRYAERRELYGRAKTSLDKAAAIEIVTSCVRTEVLDACAELIVNSELSRLIVVFPSPAFEDPADAVAAPTTGPTNALPFVFGAFLAETLGAVVEGGIVQRARIGRTKLGRFERFLWQPSFVGDVDPEAGYIIADDVATLGATFAALRTHIVENGGTVCAVTALAHESGQHQAFPVSPPTLQEMDKYYGAGIREFWKGAIGHEVDRLTEAEAKFLVWWGSEKHRAGVGRGKQLLHSLRDRLNKAASC